MLESEVSLHQSRFPAGFSRDYDAHIYFTPATRGRAQRLRVCLERDWSSQPVFVGRLIDELVGPHPLSMFEINFPKNLLKPLLNWLQENRDGLIVLVHEVTGDDPRDHSHGALWLGGALILDQSKLTASPPKPRAQSSVQNPAENFPSL